MCLGKASGYIEPKEKKAMSLLKQKTNFDEIKNMGLDDMAEKFANVELNTICTVYMSLGIPFDKSKLKDISLERKKEWKQWLESEATE